MKLRYTLLYCILMLGMSGSYAQGPVEFIQNKGQWGDWFSYRAYTKGGEICLEKDGFRYILSHPGNAQALDSFHHGARPDNPLLKFHVYKVTFEGAQTPNLVGVKPLETYNNYYFGNDPKRWKTGIHPNLGVNYVGLYPGVDMHVSSEAGNMVYEFHVMPGADPSVIKMDFKGQEGMRLHKGDLIISTSIGDVTELKPFVYQYVNDTKVEVPCQYTLHNNELGFTFPQGYDNTQALIIDPTIVFSTLTGSTADNWGYTATYDNSGNFYAGGLVNTAVFGGAFPVSPGAYQMTWGGGYGTGAMAYAADISIIKYNATGTTRLFGTYLGGLGNEHVHSMIVDGADNLVLAGRTISHDFPVTTGAFQSTNHGDWDFIVAKLNSAGTTLMASTYLGGSGGDCINFDSTETTYGQLKHNYGDDSRSEVQVDNSGNVYVTGCTFSTDFPTTSSAISASLHGVQDGVVFKMNPTLSSLLWSTYLSGNGYDAGYVLAFDTLQQYIYVAGGTTSTDFPTTAGAWHATSGGGGADGFAMKFLNSGTYALQRSTYIGTSGDDQVYGIQVGNTDDVYVMGQSVGGVFPVTAGVYSNPNSSQFVMKMDPNLTTDLASTVFGSGASTYTNISPVAFLVDTCQNVYISGWGGTLGLTGASTGSCTGMPVTPDAYQSSTDGMDFYFIVFAPDLTSLRYATFYGRVCSTMWEGEHVDGGTSRFDKHGIIYQAICANCGGTGSGSCPGFPTTAGVWGPVDGCASNCNEDALKIAFNIGPVHASVSASPSTSGCAPLTINFTNTSTNGLTYLWNFGDGSPTSTVFSATHTFTTPGVYTVTLSAYNSNACFITNDTFHLLIYVDTNRISPNFSYVVNDSCGPYSVSFTNTSVFGSTPGSSTFTVFNWNFGDGTTFTGANPGLHNFPDTGFYSVTMVMIDTTSCNSPDTVTKVISFRNLKVSGTFTIPDSVCIGTPVNPVTNINNATGTNWTFGNGQTSASGSPSVNYAAPGTYTLTLIVTNPGSCNGADTFTRSIKVMSGPTAAFSFSPSDGQANTPITYTNMSTNATHYNWDFGDGNQTADVNPVHQFNKTGTYTTCLTAYNASGCPSTACKQVSTEVIPIVGLPSAFSPNDDGENDILYVRGAAIKTMDLKIYNRWGQLVFESTSQSVGWDGKFAGQPQPIDAYGYVLNVGFIDGSSKLMKGNITLVR